MTLSLIHSSQQENDRIIEVGLEDVDHYWPEVKDLIEKSVKYDGTGTLEAVEAELRESKAQLWVAMSRGLIHAACITKVMQYPNKRGFRISHCGGYMIHAALWFMDIAEERARELGCDFIEIKGRPGWEKLFDGFRRTHVTLRKILNENTHKSRD